MVPLSTPNPPYSILESSLEGLFGGLGITLIHLDQTPAYCTAGFSAVRDGVPGFVTASHCTSNMYNPDDDAVLQYTSNLVGTAAVDPDAYTCGLRRCRGADAAFIASIGPVPMSVGLIARTLHSNAGDVSGGAGSQIIDPSNPYWYVTAEENDNLYVGQTIQKVGSATGWTWGSVTQTCVDVDGGGWWYVGNSVTRCAYEASYYSDGGDSGGPVFIVTDWAAGRVTLAGIVTGKGGFFSGRGLFSKLSRIKSDLGGTWSVLAASPPPSPVPLSAVIDGPVAINAGDFTTWTAIVNGGTPPYSYAWSGFATGTGQSVNGSGNQSGDLFLTVFDAVGHQASATPLHVAVGSGCLPGEVSCE